MTTTGTPDPAWPSDWTGSAATPIGVDEAFNGYLAANVIFGLDRLGVLAALAEHEAIDFVGFGQQHRLDQPIFEQALRAARDCGYLALDGGVARLTTAGKDMLPMRGYFTWAVGGYNELFANVGRMARGTRTFSADISRDEAMVAVGSAGNDRELMADIVNDVFADLDFSVLADLGSGISERVCRMVRGRDGTRGLGLDLSAPATELAQRTIADAGLAGRVQAKRMNVLDLVDSPRDRAELADVDTVMSFFLMHDLLADERTRPEILPRLREAFPSARRFVLTDTMLRPRTDADTSLPVFSVGYEMAHALMGVPLHTRPIYEELFRAAGLEIAQVVPCGTPHTWLYVLEAD